MSMDNEVGKHYGLLLGISSPWRVADVKLELEAKLVEVRLEWEWGADGRCPVCGRACAIYDSAPERQWRHLDTMQFKTVIIARPVRANCPEHGVLTMEVPWAEPLARVTKLFERFAIDVLLASGSVSQGCKLLGIGWDVAQQIINRAVERGLRRRELEGLKRLGLDEKSFKRGQSYVTVLTDLDLGRVLEVEEERSGESARRVFESLSAEQKAGVEAVAMDMWEPYEEVARQELPQADIVHDRYHISAYLNEAVDKVRRKEHRELLERGDETLKGTRQLWLYNPENMRPEQMNEFERLKELNLKVARAWAAKETFSRFWEYRTEGWARRFFERWYGWVRRSRLKPMVEVAGMLKRHLDNLVTYVKHRITNAVTEGLNSKIQTLKSAARGFRNFANYRARILFFCGKLNLYPL